MKNYNKIIKNFWDGEVKNFYNDNPSEYLYNFFSKIKDRKNRKVLDLGCGAGRNTIMINKLGYKVYGCDLNKKMVLATRKRLPMKIRKNIIISNMIFLPYKDDSFDYVVSNGVFHNAKNFKDFYSSISEAGRITKNNGYFILNIFIYSGASDESIKKSRGKNFYLTKNNLPIMMLPKTELIKLLSNKSLSVVSFQENFVTLPTGKRKIFKGIFIKTSGDVKNKRY